MAYNGRRGPNVSQYIANLNAIPTAQELHNSAQDNFNIDDDLAMFTNTQFFDFDVGHEDLQGDGYEGLGGQSVADESLDLKAGLDFNTGEFNFPEYNFHPTTTAFDPLHTHTPAPLQTFTPSTASSPGLISPHTAAPQSQTPTDAHNPHKRKASTLPSDDSYDIQDPSSRVLAEEDKRRRNTAASARFRVKKKQREQQLEKNAKEMSDKVAALEGRINQLETENKWLKNLVVDKKQGGDEDVAMLWKRFSEGKKEGASRTEGGKDGVGTKA